MSNNEGYNLDIGPESGEKIIFTDRRHIKVITTSVFLGMTLMFAGMVYTYASTNAKIAQRDQSINSLIDEVGALKADKLALDTEVKNQTDILKNVQENFSQIGDILSSGASDAKADTILASEGETFDVLILGTNGSLTDTMMIASVNKDLGEITLFSIPRDLYVNGRRINEYLYSYGISSLEKMLTTITGLDIEKYVKVDLNGFVDVVDIFGGIDIYVEEGIYDGLYPNSKGGYSPYSIKVGQYHMSGNDALKYARSRKSTSDFDRAARQQKIVQAVKTKITQMEAVVSMKQLTEILNTAITYVETDISLINAISYYYDYKNFEMSTGFVLSNQNYLYSQINENGAYMLLPKKGDFTDIHQAIANLVNH